MKYVNCVPLKSKIRKNACFSWNDDVRLIKLAEVGDLPVRVNAQSQRSEEFFIVEFLSDFGNHRRVVSRAPKRWDDEIDARPLQTILHLLPQIGVGGDAAGEHHLSDVIFARRLRGFVDDHANRDILEGLRHIIDPNLVTFHLFGIDQIDDAGLETRIGEIIGILAR
jgi:hypothetical protein